jgi:hypothetical protein
MWAIRRPNGKLATNILRESEDGAFFAIMMDLNFASMTATGIAVLKDRGYRAVRLVEAEELRVAVEGLEWASRRSSDNIYRSAVLALLNHFCDATKKEG